MLFNISLFIISMAGIQSNRIQKKHPSKTQKEKFQDFMLEVKIAQTLYNLNNIQKNSNHFSHSLHKPIE